jgi:hypothetical protein
MNPNTVAILLQEGGKFISQLLMIAPRKPKTVEPESALTESVISQEIPQRPAAEAAVEASKATGIEAGCLPCSIGHLGTCSGLLNEAMRFAKKDGIASGEVIQRVNMCLDELNAMERIDLRSELIVTLPAWQKPLADKALLGSRNTRHRLEGMASVDDLEQTTATLQKTRNDIGKAWFEQRLAGKES